MTKKHNTMDFISSKTHSLKFFQTFLSLPKFCLLALLASTCHQVHADNTKKNDTVVLPKTKQESIVADAPGKELKASKVVGYVDWSNYDIHAGMDYQWFDPYETESLFTDYAPDYVTELHANKEDGEEFNKSVYFSKKPWVVIFYAHWCGHCHEYVPTYKKFLKHVNNELWKWTDVVNFGTVNCGAEKERSICRQQAINGYPQIKYYKPFLNPSKKVSGDLRRGLKHLGSKNPNVILDKLTEFVGDNSEFIDKQNPGWRYFWMKDLPKSGQPAPIFNADKSAEIYKKFVEKEYKRQATKTIVYIEHRSKKTVWQVIMDMSSYRGLQIFHQVKPSTSNKGYAMIFTDGAKPIKSWFYTRMQLSDRLRNIPCIAQPIDIEDAGVGVGYDPNACSLTITTTTQPYTGPPTTKYIATTTTPQFPDPVQMLPTSDHAEAIAKMIIDEIPTELALEANWEKALAAAEVLEFFLNMKHTLNLSPIEARALQEVTDYLFTIKKSGDYDEKLYMKYVNKFPKPSSDWSDYCRGSQKNRRGYTCTLWRIFHTLSVHCNYVKPKCSMSEIMKKYIFNFFSCSDCVKNFKNETTFFMPPTLTKRNVKNFNKQEIVWLWEVHNSVNHRLAGDRTEDPEHPKIQFPLRIDCPRCYTKNSRGSVKEFNREGVYKFMMDYYRPPAFPVPNKNKQWPVGYYGFVKTHSGCPDGFQTWRRVQDTENHRPSNSYDGDWSRYISSYTGVAGLGTMMSWEFCMKRNDKYPTKDRHEWPAGDYCLVKHADKDCPAGFSEGWLHWDDENRKNQNSYYGSVYSRPSGIYDRDTQIDFCCRSDGNVRDKIKLPNNTPYTLFPHTTKSCQRVMHKTAKRAWFSFDMEDDTEKTHQHTMTSGVSHPFVKNLGDGMRLYVCVYHD